MTERYFPDDHEVDQWITTHFLDDTDAGANPIMDQLNAATSDSVNRFCAAAPALVADGRASWAFLGVPDQDRTKIRGAVRQVIAAESVGLTHLCPHTQQIRPLVLICDPPVVVCTECLPSRLAAIEAVGHFWNHECDRCGVRVQQLTPVTIGGLGHLTISGHVCSRCAAGDRRLAVQHADEIVAVPRRGDRHQHRGGGR